MAEFVHVKDWYTISEYVDTETGEIISKKLANRDYQIYKTNKKVEINNGKGIIKYTNECRKSNQYKLW